MTITFASLFTGGGGADLGAIAAGLTPIWGIEKDPDISYWGHKNIVRHKRTYLNLYSTNYQDINTIDFSWLKRPDWLHASPPCVNASLANNGTETSEDMELAEAICRAIVILKPKYFSLENVAGYSKFYSFEKIKACLTGNGYEGDFNVLDCSDYGVPQSRKRLFLVAVKGIKSKDYLSRLKKQKPIGWKEAIADLIPSLEETTLTNWQIQAVDNCDRVWKETSRLNRSNPPHFIQVANYLIQRSGARKKNGLPNNTIRLENEPMFTLKSMSGTVRPSVHQATIVINGQALQPAIRCYARWQTFPDSYQWSDDFKLNVKICGNAVPPLMFQQIIEAILND